MHHAVDIFFAAHRIKDANGNFFIWTHFFNTPFFYKKTQIEKTTV